eukprot:NP_001355365.1 Uncharacterized protein CELE_F16B12.5 [Caenorhabditis elegans]
MTHHFCDNGNHWIFANSINSHSSKHFKMGILQSRLVGPFLRDKMENLSSESILSIEGDESFLDDRGNHREVHNRHYRKGTYVYMSANQHHEQCFGNTRRDDMESLVYSLRKILDLTMCWKEGRSVNNDDTHRNYFNLKQGNQKSCSLCGIQPINDMLQSCRMLEFKDEPNYEAVKQLFVLDKAMSKALKNKKHVPPKATFDISLDEDQQKLIDKFNIYFNEEDYDAM